MNNSNRLYNCAKCHQQIIICSYCDRGNIYCFDGCATIARKEYLKQAGQRYQKSLQGRRTHAARQAQYRLRQIKKVTHQGSPAQLINTDFTDGKITNHEDISGSDCYYCHFCGRNKSTMLRRHFLHQQTTKNKASSKVLEQGP